ncbi:MAG: carbamoyl phosphate synthase small subunit [Oscillospiraceae bacterium]|nr:carbamoyl phosphate synthase small subunit [Oscillospiraceae bacterium]
MSTKAYLVLENGKIFEGSYFGAQGDITGEIVFTTGMTGYLETLTDPSYHGQIVLQTFPLIGNYGVIPADFESSSIGPIAYITKCPCQDPSNFRSEGSLGTFLDQRGIIGICDIDTRALTKMIRENGVMNGKIMKEKPDERDMAEIKSYFVEKPIAKVSISEKKLAKAQSSKFTVALMDFGAKENIRRELIQRGCDVWSFPYSSTPEEILSVSPDGIMLSNGPGDPKDNMDIVETIRALLKENVPMFGICMGHQLLALASGFKTGKLKFGHRGANQPVKDLIEGRCYITSQNHGYQVLSDSMDESIAEEWFVNVNDGSNEGIIYKNAPAFSVQFHPEGCGGPQDTGYLFDKFIKLMEERRGC